MYYPRAAILMVMISLNWDLESVRTCVLRVDNQAAADALVKGSTSSELMSALSGLLRHLASMGDAMRWVEYVKTESSASDFPHRECDIPCPTNADAWKVYYRARSSGYSIRAAPPVGNWPYFKSASAFVNKDGNTAKQ